MAPDERPPETTGPSTAITFTTTDPRGRNVWMTEANYIEHCQHWRHPEIKNLEPTVHAVEDPAWISVHSEDEELEWYVGRPRPPIDIQYAERRRLVLVKNTSPEGLVVTTYDLRTTRMPRDVGEVIWRPSDLPGSSNRSKP